MRRLPILVLTLSCLAANGQWLNYPTPNVPRTPDGKPNLSAPAPRTADGRPDFTGLWEMVQEDLIAPSGVGCLPIRPEWLNIGAYLPGGLPYQPSTAALVKIRSKEGRLHDPFSNGLPMGLVRLHTYPEPRKMIQIPGLLVILNEPNSSFRQIFTDGRPPLADPNPTWNGYSTAKWDGDVLVVQTNGIREGTWLDANGNPLTEAAKVTERFRRLNFGHLEIELTVDDPKAYTKPWTGNLKVHLLPDTELLEVTCENSRGTEHMVGK